MTARTARTTAADEGERLDRWLARTFPDVSRTRFQSLIAEGHVTVEGQPVGEPRYRLLPGQNVSVELPEPDPAEPQGEPIPLNILFEDAALLVIDKPAGLVVHPGAGHTGGTLVNALIAHCGDSLSGIGGVKRPGIVHRLDKDTSGLLVVAKTDAAHRGLSAQFAAHGQDGRLERAYLAFVWGVPDRAKGTISAPLARAASNRTRIAVSGSGRARQATTHFRLLEQFDRRASLLECRLETGRTHQIRVHLAHIGHPLLADPVYGKGFRSSVRTLGPAARDAVEKLGRQALHAAVLGFHHPLTGAKLRFESPLAPELARLHRALKEPEGHSARNSFVKQN